MTRAHFFAINILHGKVSYISKNWTVCGVYFPVSGLKGLISTNDLLWQVLYFYNISNIFWYNVFPSLYYILHTHLWLTYHNSVSFAFKVIQSENIKMKTSISHLDLHKAKMWSFPCARHSGNELLNGKTSESKTKNLFQLLHAGRI